MSKTTNKWLVGGAIGIGVLSAFAAMRRARRKIDFDGKVVLITGGARGLGLVLARQFADEGAKLAVCSRETDDVGRAQAELEEGGAEVFAATCDVRNQSEVERFVKDVCMRFGRIDVLINNAGVIQVGPLESQTQEDFEDSLATHFWGAFYAMQAVIPRMKLQGAGRIANIASIGGKVAVPHLAPYSAGKFALVGLSDALRAELRKDDIFVTTICPGLMRTGSHINATFKGQNEKEYALFSISNALPLASVSVESAARQILRSISSGDAELIISPQAKLAVKMNALFPELTADISGLVNRLLPSAEGGIGKSKATGLESTSALAPSLLTSLADAALYQNNELKPNETIS